MQFEKGLKLYATARSKSRQIGLDTGKIGLDELVWKIQEKEGNPPCFRRQKVCSQMMCCWQAACGAEMVES